MLGEKVHDAVDHPLIRGQVAGVAQTYTVAQDPDGEKLLVADGLIELVEGDAETRAGGRVGPQGDQLVVLQRDPLDLNRLFGWFCAIRRNDGRLRCLGKR